MQTVRLVHAADFHLGSPMSQLPYDKALIRKKELEKTFLAMTDICREHKAHVLLLAGDIVDCVRPDQGIERLLADAFSSIPDTRIFISPGNHDPYTIDSIYESARFGDNVHIFDGCFAHVELPEIQTIVWGVGFPTMRCTRPLYPSDQSLRTHLPDKADWLHLLVMHGQLLASENSDTAYHPIDPAWLEKSGVDYVALGHVHDPTKPVQVKKTVYAYAGCPEPRGFDEAGPRGVFVGTATPGKVRMDYREINLRTYHRVDIDITDAQNQTEATSRVVSDLEARFMGAMAKDAFRITLTGALPPDLTLSLSALRERLEEDVFLARVKDATRVAWDAKAVAQEKTLRGRFSFDMLKRLESAKPDDEAVVRLALDLGFRAFEDEVFYRED